VLLTFKAPWWSHGDSGRNGDCGFSELQRWVPKRCMEWKGAGRVRSAMRTD